MSSIMETIVLGVFGIGGLAGIRLAVMSMARESRIPPTADAGR